MRNALAWNGAREAPVLVTGATGYVAGWLISRLLKAGTRVHATVRDPSDKARVAHLHGMADAAPGTITLFKADLLEPGSHDAAMAGCRVVFHTASPFLHPDKIASPLDDLVEPAVKGTSGLLDSVNRNPGVDRVVLTSSGAAMSGGPADLARAPGGVIDERSWNTVSSIENGPYLHSKTLAERTAWRMAEAQKRWRLVVINPGLVLGPGTARNQTSASFDYVRALSDGSQETAPHFTVGMVDVRDVAEAHFRAGFFPDAEGRHIVIRDILSLGDLADMLRDTYGAQWPFAAHAPIRDDFPPVRMSNRKSRLRLGMEYRPIKPALIAMFDQMVETGLLQRCVD